MGAWLARMVAIMMCHPQSKAGFQWRSLPECCNCEAVFARPYRYVDLLSLAQSVMTPCLDVQHNESHTMSVQCVSRASDNVAQPTELDVLPDELLAKLMRSTGVKDALASLPHNSRLHRAWQTAVEGLSIRDSPIHEEDIRLIKKYINLKRLSVANISTAGIPAWQVVWQLSCLEELVQLSAQGSSIACSILPVVCTSHLHSRLQSLDLHQDSDLSFSDLASLGLLTSLRSLSLTCSGIEGPCSDAELSRLRTACASLQSLGKLTIYVETDTLEAGLAAVFPGSLTGLTSLHLTSNATEHAEDEECAVISAIFGLVNLEELDTNYEMHDPQMKNQVVAQLTHLTRLVLRQAPLFDEEVPELLPLPQHSMLQELCAEEMMVQDPFQLRSLRKLEASAVEVPEALRGAVLQAWPLQELVLNLSGFRQAEDAVLQDFPTVPSLTTFRIYSLAPSGIAGTVPRYLQLASMLGRHAGHLKEVLLSLTQQYLEPFPAALPACRTLYLLSSAASTRSLALLRHCALPALQELYLRKWVEGTTGEMVLATLQQDLGWLAGLPALQKVEVRVLEPGLAELKQALVALLPGQQVEVLRFWGP